MISRHLFILISPLGTAFVLAFLSFILIAIKRFRSALVLTVLVVAWLYFWSMPLISFQLQSCVESAYRPMSISEIPNSPIIVTLGGGISPPSIEFPFINLNQGADRTYHAAKLYKAGKAPLIVLSGGSDPKFSGGPEAQAMAMFIEDLGVPKSALLLEDASRNTKENAIYTAKLLKERNIDHIILVTSALHMERAKQFFEDQGLVVLPSATDYEATIKPDGPLAYLPDTDALDGSSRALKELVGRWGFKVGKFFSALN